MGKKKIIYFGLLLIVTVMVIVTSFSYSFLIKTEEHHGKLNIVTGTLNYKISSKLLNNNSITLASNEKARLNIKIESLNTIDSKYELYYTSTNPNIEIGYMSTSDQPTGTINGSGSDYKNFSLLFGAHERSNYASGTSSVKNQPSLVCANKNDSFTVSNGSGNQKLTYPVALLTEDEMALAGGYQEYKIHHFIYIMDQLIIGLCRLLLSAAATPASSTCTVTASATAS